MGSEAITFDHVSFAYDKRPILKTASFAIQQGEYIGLIGPNGGGKTTALKLLLGFLKPSSGTIVNTIPFAKTSYLPQNPTYDKAFPISVIEVVLSGLTAELSWLGRRSADAKSRALEALDRVGLVDLAHSHYGSLSGGESQRVLLARALVSRPDLLILDEPTANVDTAAEESILSLLAELKGSLTMLIVTHDFDAVIPHVDRVLCFQQEVASLKPSEVCQHFAIGLYHQVKEEDNA